MSSSKTAPVSTLKVLSAGAVKGGVAKLAAEFERATRTRVTVDYAPAPDVRDRITAGEAADVVILAQAMMDEVAKQGKILPDSRALLGTPFRGKIQGVSTMSPGDIGRPAVKVGRTTGFTRGKCTAVEIDGLSVGYDIGLVRFNNCLYLAGAANGTEFEGTSLSGTQGWIMRIPAGLL